MTSKEPRSFLFIGGPLDGEVHPVEGQPGRHEVDVVGRGNDGLRLRESYGYILEPIYLEQGAVVLHFYRYEPMRMAEAVLRLLANYCDSADKAARILERR